MCAVLGKCVVVLGVECALVHALGVALPGFEVVGEIVMLGHTVLDCSGSLEVLGSEVLDFE